MPHVLVLGLQSQQLLTLEMQEFEAQDVLLGHLAGLDAIICSGRIHDEEVMKRVVQCLLLVAGRDARLKPAGCQHPAGMDRFDLGPLACSRIPTHAPWTDSSGHIIPIWTGYALCRASTGAAE